ncbi:MAG TPA: TonB-dependent receptor [Polyangiaceae bacterium]|nr:TonB-dependent receptor [Polyangiaceae bacterium]
MSDNSRQRSALALAFAFGCFSFTSLAAAQAPPAAPLEVVVEGERAAPTSAQVTREQARALPGTFGDPLRAIEAEPGVTPIVSGLPYFFVRGAPPANVGFFIDGVDVPLLYHAFFGPSVIHPGLIQDVSLYSGVAPVEYGHFAGPVVAATTRPASYEFNGEATVRAIDAGALVEAPFGPCEGVERPGCARGSALVGGRYSYTGLVLSLLSDTKLSYWDYQARVGYRLSPRDEVRLFAFGAYDYFDAGDSGIEKVGGTTQFHRLDLRYEHAFSAATRVGVAVTLGFDRTGDEKSLVRDRSLRGRLELKHSLSPRNTLKAGADVRADGFSLAVDERASGFHDFSQLFPARNEFLGGTYVMLDWHAAPGIRVVPGVRADYYRSQGQSAFGVDPRISAEFVLAPGLRVEHAIGLSHQPPNFVPAIPGAQVADLKGGLQEALVASAGVRYELFKDVNAQATVFRSAFFNALDPIGGGRQFTVDAEVLQQRATISSVGFELKLVRPLTRRLGGFLAYTLSHTREASNTWVSVAGFDRPHVLQGALAYDFGAGVRAAVRAVYYSGIPARVVGTGRPLFDGDRRGDPYFRLDARFEKRFRLGEKGMLSLVAEVLNATSSTEVLRLDCGNICQVGRAGPVVLPSVGAEAHW